MFPVISGKIANAEFWKTATNPKAVPIIEGFTTNGIEGINTAEYRA